MMKTRLWRMACAVPAIPASQSPARNCAIALCGKTGKKQTASSTASLLSASLPMTSTSGDWLRLSKRLGRSAAKLFGVPPGTVYIDYGGDDVILVQGDSSEGGEDVHEYVIRHGQTVWSAKKRFNLEGRKNYVLESIIPRLVCCQAASFE